MTFGEVKNTDYETRKQQQKQRELEIKESLDKCLANIGYEISDIKIDFNAYDEAGSVMYRFKLDDGFEQEDSAYWLWDDSEQKLADKIKKHIDYIIELRKKYPEFAEVNDYIQSKRLYKKVCNLKHNGYTRPCLIEADLCGYLKLPNETSCSCVGGDYEIKRTPIRLEDFNNNIDTLCIFLAGCISDLQAMKYNRK